MRPDPRAPSAVPRPPTPGVPPLYHVLRPQGSLHRATPFDPRAPSAVLRPPTLGPPPLCHALRPQGSLHCATPSDPRGPSTVSVPPTGCAGVQGSDTQNSPEV